MTHYPLVAMYCRLYCQTETIPDPFNEVCLSFQKMCQSYNAEEQKRIVMDLDVVLKSHDCPFIVACLGAYISEV